MLDVELGIVESMMKTEEDLQQTLYRLITLPQGLFAYNCGSFGKTCCIESQKSRNPDIAFPKGVRRKMDAVSQTTKITLRI